MHNLDLLRHTHSKEGVEKTSKFSWPRAELLEFAP